MKIAFTIIFCVFSGMAYGKVSLPTFFPSERIQINTDEMEIDAKSDYFIIHIGNNEWIEADQIYRDERGVYTFESHITPSFFNLSAYEKKWKCPYCFNLYVIGNPCTKADCPSKYR